MVQTVFSLRFTAQLHRTRPELIHRVESTIKQAIQNAGGTISTGRQCITAVYNEQNLGFWLDILMLMETVINTLEEEKSELYGYALLISKDILDRPESLCRSLASGPQEGGIFLDPAAQDALKPYIAGEPIKKWPSGRPAVSQGNAGQENLVRVKEFKNLLTPARQIFPLRETILAALEQGQKRNTLIQGPAYSGKRDGVYCFCRKYLSGFPPLIIRFGLGGLNALCDAWSDSIQKLAENSHPENMEPLKEINSLWENLFQQRLRDEISPFMIQKGRRFFTLLLEMYVNIAKQNKVTPALILENIHKAEKSSAQIFMDVISSLPDRQKILILGICSREIPENELKNWERIFPRIIKLDRENNPPPPPQMPIELWEICYSLYLFNRCFPASMATQLLKEEGKNPAMISGALSILYAQGIIDSIEDPQLRINNFNSKAEVILGEKKELIKAIIRRRLLSRVKLGNLSPCFNLLTILASLNGDEKTEDELILKSIYADLVNGTLNKIEAAIKTGLLQTITGTERAQAIIYIYQTMRALIRGGENDIRSAFNTNAPDCSLFPVLNAQAQINISAYQLGIRNAKPAMDTIKEAILLSQGKNSYCLAQAYRLFSLVNISRQQAGETNEYLNFAMENAEKTGNDHELGISAYYAAASQFLFGNVSKALRLAQKAREQTLTFGLPDWADRARFLEGRLIFEIGFYREALEIFEELQKKPSGWNSPEKDRLLAAWEYRAQVFLRNPLFKKPENSGREADIFEIEAAYLAGNYPKTVELANALSLLSIDENFLFTEQADWRNGFAQCELLYFSPEDIWKRLVCTYHSLALCRISPEYGEEAMNNMRHILRDERLSEMDPWDAFYFYAWYRVLEQTGAEQIDMNTAVSMAFKRLQRRASRIDDTETRRTFLSRPRWNSELSRAAKEFRLI